MRIPTFSMAAGAAVALLAALPAAATTFDYSSYSVLNNQNVGISGPDVDITGGSGEITLYGAAGTADAGLTLDAWCIDIFSWLQPYNDSGTFTYTYTSPATSDGAAGGTPLTATATSAIIQLIQIGDANLAAGTLPVGISGSAYDLSSAIQVAIWEEEFGNEYTFSPSGTVATMAAALEASLLPSAPLGYNLQAITGTDGTGTLQNQELVFVVDGTPVGGTPIPAPEPASLALLGSGLLGLLALRRRA